MAEIGVEVVEMPKQNPLDLAKQTFSRAKDRFPHINNKLALSAASGLAFLLTACAPVRSEMPPQPPPISGPVVAGQDIGTESKEALKELSPNVLIIDIAPTEKTERMNQIEFPDKEITDSIDVPQEVKDVIIARRNHGNLVFDAMQHTWNEFGFTSSVNMAPLQNVLDYSKVESSKNEFGENFFMAIEPDALIEMIKQYPDQKVVNMSFQLGKIGFSLIDKQKRSTYENPYFQVINRYEGEDRDRDIIGIFPRAASGVQGGSEGIQYLDEKGEIMTPISTMTAEEFEESEERKKAESFEIVKKDFPSSEIIGAYNADNVEANIPKLFEIAQAFPDKLFVSASGNEGEDLRSIKNRPANLLIVSEWTRAGNDGQLEKPFNDVYGADLYVDNGYVHGSSFSTAVISAIASILAEQGLKPEEIRSKMLSETTDLVNFKDKEGNNQIATVFNPELAHSIIQAD